MTEIVRASIHPGIGIARIGDSDAFVLAPQVPTPKPHDPGSFHDDAGALKREAAEFRIYGYNAAGEVVAEISAETADINWSVHLAATKAAWYKFRAALDLPAASGFSLERRNPDYDTSKRSDLTIDPGPQSIAPGDHPKTVVGEFIYEGTQTAVTIGELQTDEAGRLRILSGPGKSGSPTGLPVYNPTEEDAFANATGWYDEISDGPVSATVEIDGQEIPCEGAWVLISPPAYAPDFIGWRTMLDLCEEIWIEAGWMEEHEEVSFTRDIYPILYRLTQLQWLNKGFHTYFGPAGPFDFSDGALIDKMARKHGTGDIYRPFRRQIFNMFRPASGEGASPRSQPWIYGDAFGTFPATDPDVGLPLWPRAARKLQAWAIGDFVEDWNTGATPHSSLDEAPLADQPSLIDRAALTFCVADAFHPGIEMPFAMRHITLWSAPFRIRPRAASNPEPDYGTHLTTARALGQDGPLHAQPPGGLTRWMAIPWQVDTASCRFGYDRDYSPLLPTFWPARVPNQVLTQADYETVMDTSKTDGERVEAFYTRISWYEALEQFASPGTRLTFRQSLDAMVEHFAMMGVVECRPGPTDLEGVPHALYVEVQPLKPAAGLTPQQLVEGAPVGPEMPEDREARDAGWRSEAQRLEFIDARTQYARRVSGSPD